MRSIPIAEEDLQRALRKLADAELLYVRGIVPDAAYQFKHALIRDAAYEALLRSRRKDLHRLIARTIDERFMALKAAQPEVLARHWTEAGEIELAIGEWSTAGKIAWARNAFREALESFKQALALLNLLAESPYRDHRELELRMSVYNLLWLTRGPAEPETIDATERAAAIAEKAGSLGQLIDWLLSKGYTVINSGGSHSAAPLADRVLDLAVRDGNLARLGFAHALQIATRYFCGDLAGAEKHFTGGLKYFDDASFRRAPGFAVSTFGFASLSAWTLGKADLARERISRTMAAANAKNPFDLAFSENYAAQLWTNLGEYKKAETSAVRALELSEKYEFKSLAPVSKCILGRARAELGGATEGVALIQEGIAALLELGLGLRIGLYRAFLARAREREGAVADALETIEVALQFNRDELVYRPDTLRLCGELRLKQGQTESAEADFREAIALAQKIGAKAWELRATMSLARMLAQQGRCDEARTMLADIYGWFTEGFDAADLKDAKSLLDQLAA